MKLQAFELLDHLRKKIYPVYWFSGDESFLVQQSLKDLIRVLEGRGFSVERVSVSSHFSEEMWFGLTHELSLFSNKRLLILSLEGKLPPKFLRFLKTYITAPQPDLVIGIGGPRLAMAVTLQAEFKQWESLGVHIPIWPIPLERLPHFLQEQARRYSLKLLPEAAEILAVLTEGNLFAADQALEKLAMMNGSKIVSAEDLRSTVHNQSHFDLFDLVSAALWGDLSRAWRIWTRVQVQGMEPVLILWALMKELRLLVSLQEELGKQSLPELFKQHKFRDQRAREVRQALHRLEMNRCFSLLQLGAKIDRVIKGREKGNVELLLGELIQGFCCIASRDFLRF